MMRNFITIAIGLFVCLSARSQTPHLSGKVEIVMSTGQITCDFIISNIPDLGRDYQVFLNKGFNIKAIKDSSNRTLSYGGFYNGTMKGEGLSYTPEINDSTVANPKQLHISYTGAFPVYKDTLNFLDFKGLIAFNGKTLRAADQSKWYPIIYDTKNERLLEQVTFDIQVTAKDARTIFVNGDLPKPGPAARFTSGLAIAPMLFVGDYNTQKTSGALFLNTAMSNQQLAIFEKNIAEIKSFYYQKLKIPYDTKNVFIEHKPVEEFKSGRSWGFVSFPVIAFAGFPLAEMTDEKTGQLKDSSYYPYLGHEIAHYYFGNVLQPNSTLFWFFLESTAEYLSVKAAEQKFGKQYGTAYFSDKAKQMKNFKVKPLNTITNMNDVSGNYRYHYGPFILRAMENMMGEEQVYKFLRTCLNAKRGLTDYNFLKQSALQSGISQKDWDVFEERIIKKENIVGEVY